jgi:hypothetical protein
MNAAIFWDIVPCSLYATERFGGTYHLSLQGRKLAELETSVQKVTRYAACWVLARLLFYPEDGSDVFL